jgi:sortase (surface protein transpeptidase)
VALTVSVATLIALPGALYLTRSSIDVGQLPALDRKAVAAEAAVPSVRPGPAPLASPWMQFETRPDREASESDPIVSAERAVPPPEAWTRALERLGDSDDVPTPAVSPIFGETPVHSALARDALKKANRPVPVQLSIPAIDVRASIDSAGVERRTRQLDVPNSAEGVVWYEHGPAPGEEGSAVLAAHVDFNGVAGAFFRLHDLGPGDRIAVKLSDGTTSRFEVVARRKYNRERLPSERVFTSSGPPVLTLITCGGRFDSDRGHYASNVVVFAIPLERA